MALIINFFLVPIALNFVTVIPAKNFRPGNNEDEDLQILMYR